MGLFKAFKKQFLYTRSGGYSTTPKDLRRVVLGRSTPPPASKQLSGSKNRFPPPGNLVKKIYFFSERTRGRCSTKIETAIVFFRSMASGKMSNRSKKSRYYWALHTITLKSGGAKKSGPTFWRNMIFHTNVNTK